ncbi:peptidylprolyl isomerase [Sediminihabitans luteus]|uniref:FKBP-type peptidyl-prolyl cis-trans isomerase n=1 Tax=Sediminihabitans luteus TaxID=1138585 RepID=UPI000C24DFEC|nr:FKBP-type peptidyl-prolyl cis-trans isomerase [Sediminihabitans luteus]GIJ00467.1 peptidylprolyl isomerase [Sediminihabitans luteus]
MRRAVALVCALVTVLVLGACGEGLSPEFKDPVAAAPATDSPVTVTGAADVPPVLEYEAPLTVTHDRSQVVWPGVGEVLTDGDPVLLNMYAEDGRNRKIVQDTWVASPRLLRLDPADVGDQLYEALLGQRVGARLLVVSTEEDTLTEASGTMPLVLTVDVLPTRASGTPVTLAEGEPQVRTGKDGIPTVTVPEGDPPSELEVRTVVRGSGAQVEPGDLVTVRYVGVKWSDGEEFDSNWESGSVLTALFGLGTVVDGWEQGLLEHTAGSRVLLVVPPALAYGGTDSPLADETLVYVVDILDTRSAVAADNSSGEGTSAETEEG